MSNLWSFGVPPTILDRPQMPCNNSTASHTLAEILRYLSSCHTKEAWLISAMPLKKLDVIKCCTHLPVNTGTMILGCTYIAFLRMCQNWCMKQSQPGGKGCQKKHCCCCCCCCVGLMIGNFLVRNTSWNHLWSLWDGYVFCLCKSCQEKNQSWRGWHFDTRHFNHLFSKSDP